MDFTIKKYIELIETLKEGSYSFQTMSEFLEHPADGSIILRHDVDARKLYSLKFARIQNDMGIKGTYYFRMVSKSFDEGVIREIEDMGHEIGYHYEDMDFGDGNPDRAIQLFEQHLNKLREVVTVKTACMHGSPLSKYDNRDLWKHFNYRDYDLIGEPYFDIDFNEVFYLTDTGRRWDDNGVSIRDTTWVPDEENYRVPVKTTSISDDFAMKSYRFTDQIIADVKKNKLPHKVMFNFHPQRWTDNKLLWAQELVLQNVKNIIKKGVRKFRNS